MSKQTSKEVISEEVAVNEVLEFINRYSKKPIEIDTVKESHSAIVEAVQIGKLVFNENKVPTYTLQFPLISEGGGVHKDVIEFKTRIKPTTKADLAKGIDLAKDVANYSLRLIAFIIGCTVKELDLFEPEDYDVISEVAAVFMAGGR